MTINLTDDTASGGHATGDVFTGSAFANVTGSNFDDFITGNSNSNALRGGSGMDTLTGGDGADRFQYFEYGNGAFSDTITDFEINDTLELGTGFLNGNFQTPDFHWR